MNQRTLSAPALLFASVTAILGSGWLFAAYNTAKFAGPAAILSWVIGGFLIMFVAFVFAELTTMLPITGSSTRIPQFTHGTLVGFLFSWIIFLSYVSLAPIEVQGVLQYANYFFPGLLKIDGGLTLHGYLAAAVLMVLMSALNIYSLRWLIRSNNFLTILKIIIPVFISLVILAYTYQPGKIIHSAHSSFAPWDWRGS
ncbi:APC family permease [Dongshaea marina]|uniref:APC family permease n=1 Tax=Dongshaea marina TaxID=2047966 RepID=UPI001900E1DD|nr:APC family permease [Dongshaea marina]